MKKFLFLLSAILFLSCNPDKKQTDTHPLSDNNIETTYVGANERNLLLIDSLHNTPVQSYSIYSSSDSAKYDPSGWIKAVFGQQASIEGMWEEYQQFLTNDINK